MSTGLHTKPTSELQSITCHICYLPMPPNTALML